MAVTSDRIEDPARSTSSKEEALWLQSVAASRDAGTVAKVEISAAGDVEVGDSGGPAEEASEGAAVTEVEIAGTIMTLSTRTCCSTGTRLESRTSVRLF